MPVYDVYEVVRIERILTYRGVHARDKEEAINLVSCEDPHACHDQEKDRGYEVIKVGEGDWEDEDE